ncbi:MAG TPA: universal stress protein [Solirubrobacteraceae bacterium]|nr:universal stress protein [Solirubrobacteraceae bacterium]
MEVRFLHGPLESPDHRGFFFGRRSRSRACCDGAQCEDRRTLPGLDSTARAGADGSNQRLGEPDLPQQIGGGEPGKTIARMADQLGSDLVVVGNKGIAGARRRWLGSEPRLARRCLRCPDRQHRRPLLPQSHHVDDSGR